MTTTSSSVAAADGPLDARRLQALAELGAEARDRAVAIYLRESPETVAEVRRAVAARDLAGVRRLAHDLAGSSMVFGARRVVELCRRLTAAARDGDAAACGALAEELAEETRRVTEHLAAWRGQ